MLKEPKETIEETDDKIREDMRIERRKFQTEMKNLVGEVKKSLEASPAADRISEKELIKLHATEAGKES